MCLRHVVQEEVVSPEHVRVLRVVAVQQRGTFHIHVIPPVVRDFRVVERLVTRVGS